MRKTGAADLPHGRTFEDDILAVIGHAAHNHPEEVVELVKYSQLRQAHLASGDGGAVSQNDLMHARHEERSIAEKMRADADCKIGGIVSGL